MRLNRKLLAAGFCTLCTTLVAMPNPNPNLTERFPTSSSGWTYVGTGSTNYYTNQALCIWINKKDPGTGENNPADGTYSAISNSSQGAFFGNFGTANVYMVEFDIAQAGIDYAQLLFKSSKTNTTWKYTLPETPSGVVTHVTVPFEYSSNLWLSLPPNKGAADFDIAKTAVKSIQFFASRDVTNLAAQTLYLDNVVLAGDWQEFDSDKVSVWWYVEYGITNAAQTNGTYDSDNDGLPNRGEFWLGTNPTNTANPDRVAAIIERNAQGRTIVRWPHARNGLTSLVRASDLTNAATFVEMSTNGIIRGTTNDLQDVNDDGNGPYFYRVRLGPK